MTDAIQRALSQATQSTSGRKAFDTNSGGLGVRAQTNNRSEFQSTGFADSMNQFVKNAGDAFGAHEASMKTQADERSNEIIRKMTPAERRAAIESGTLLYKDDPYAMAALRQKSGRNAAYGVDEEIQLEIQKGTFRNRQELDVYRQTRMEQASKSYAEDAGIDPNDSLYQKGFNADISQRNAAVYDLHGQWLSKNYEAQAVVETRADIAPLMNDQAFFKGAKAPGTFATYFNEGLTSGIFPSDGHAIKAIQLATSEAVNKPGGAQFLDGFQDQEITVYGAKHKVRDLIGGDVYDNLRVKAQEASYTRDSKAQEVLSLDLNNALYDPDPASGFLKIQEIKRKNNMLQPGTELTAQRQQIIQAESRLQALVVANTQKTAADLTKRTQADNRQMVIGNAYEDRVNGKSISVDPRFLPVNEATGEKFTPADMATFAASKYRQIDAMSVPDEQKDSMKLALLRADYDKGPFQAAMGTLITDAGREWQAALIQPETPKSMPRLEELQRAYAADPGTISQLYGEQAGLLEKLRYGKENGIGLDVLVDAEKLNKAKSSPDDVRYRNDQWASIKNDSTYKELKYLPGTMEAQARSVFDATVQRSGDSVQAAKDVSEFLKKTTVSFVNDNGYTSTDSFHGMISKRDLMADPNDINSWEAGKAIVDDTMARLKTDPEWAAGGITVTSADGNITLQNLTGVRVRISKQAMQNLYQDQQAVKREQALQEGIKDAQKTNDLREKYILGGGRKQ